MGSKVATLYFVNVNGVKEDSFVYNFNVVDCISISGVVFSDVNNDCVKQSGESIISNTDLQLLDASGNVLRNSYTNIQGEYSFNKLSPNTTYKLKNNSSLLNCSVANALTVNAITADVVKDLGIKDTMIISSKNLWINFDSTNNFNTLCLLDSLGVSLNIGKSNGTLDIKYIWGDGTTQTYVASSGSYDYQWRQHKYATTGSYTILIEFLHNGIVIDTFLRSVVVSTCGNLSGKLYIDSNKNCIFNSSEIEVRYYPITIKNAATGAIIKTIYTDYTGNYSVNLDNTLSYRLYMDQNILCRDGNNYVNVPAWTSTFITKDIPLNPDSINYQVYAFHAGSTFPNMYSNIYFGCNGLFLPNNQQYHITIPAKTKFDYSSNPNYTISGNVITVNISNNYNYNYIRLRMDTTLVQADTLCFTVELVPIGSESILIDNTTTICRPALVSYDPNDKSASSASMAKDGSFTNPKDELVYKIRFQNTGNAPAMNINVKDIIDENVDINSLKVLAMSHKGAIYQNENREVKFDFPNIMLADSVHDEKNSHGYIIYSVKPKDNLVLNTSIKNTARIYFDYNEAVITNTTVNTYKLVEVKNSISSSKEVDFSIYKNSNELLIQSAHKMDEIYIFDLLGKVLYSTSQKTNAEMFSIENMSSGIYIVHVTIGENKVIKKIKL